MGYSLGRGMYCLEGVGLRAYWEQIHGILAGAGMTMENIRNAKPYQDALEQYKEHLKTCQYCSESIRLMASEEKV